MFCRNLYVYLKNCLNHCLKFWIYNIDEKLNIKFKNRVIGGGRSSFFKHKEAKEAYAVNSEEEIFSYLVKYCNMNNRIWRGIFVTRA